MSKLDWDKVNTEKLMFTRGTEIINRKKPSERVENVRCRYCRMRLENDTQAIETDHLEICNSYRVYLSAGKNRERPIFSGGIMPARPVQEFAEKDDFPDCMLGEIVRTRSFVGKVIQISDDKSEVVLKGHGERRTFTITTLLKPPKRKKIKYKSRS